MTPEPSTIANIVSPKLLTPPSSNRRKQGAKLHREIQRMALPAARKLKRSLDEWFDMCYDAIVYGVRTQMEMGLKPIKKGINLFKAETPASMVARLVDWGCLDARGIQYVRPTMLEYAVRGANGAIKYTRFTGSFTIDNPAINRWASQHSAKLVREITRTMRANIRAAITTGVKGGHGVGEIASQIRNLDGFALTTRQVGYVDSYRKRLELTRVWGRAVKEQSDLIQQHIGKLPGKVSSLSVNDLNEMHETLLGRGGKYRIPNTSKKAIDVRVNRYRNRKLRQRSITISRTESINSLSEGTLQGWRAAGVGSVEFMASSDACPVCSDLDGHVFRIEEASGIIAVHSNCRCTFLNRDQGTEAGSE